MTLVMHNSCFCPCDYNIGESNKMEIVPNMILTFHPSLLDKNGEGVLYADTYVSTEGGARCLTDKYRESH